MCNKCRRDCETCQDLIEKYGEENLKICPYCEHYYYGNACNCGLWEEEAEKGGLKPE